MTKEGNGEGMTEWSIEPLETMPLFVPHGRRRSSLNEAIRSLPVDKALFVKRREDEEWHRFVSRITSNILHVKAGAHSRQDKAGDGIWVYKIWVYKNGATQ